MLHDARKDLKHIGSIMKKVCFRALCGAVFQDTRKRLRDVNCITENIRFGGLGDANPRIPQNAAETSILLLKMFVLERFLVRNLFRPALTPNLEP